MFKTILSDKVPVNVRVEGNEEADKAAKPAIDVLGMTTIRLPFTDNYLINRRDRIFEGQRKWANSTKKLKYIKTCI